MMRRYKQQGAALITALVCLILVSMMGVVAMRTSGTNAKVASNAKLAAQTMHLATSALNAFFINPRATWNLNTTQGTISTFPSVPIGNVNMNLQAEYTGDFPCVIEKGSSLDSGDNGSLPVCIYFRAASHYENVSGGESTVSAGFWAKSQK